MNWTAWWLTVLGWAVSAGIITWIAYMVLETVSKNHHDRYWAEVDRRADANTYRVDRS